MSGFQIVWTVLGAIITIAGLVLAFARVSPEDAKANLSRWSAAAGILKLPAFLRGISWERARRVMAALVTGIGAFITTGAGLYHQVENARSLYNRYEIVQADEIRDLKRQVEEFNKTPKPASNTKTGFLGLDDAERWKLASTLRTQTVNAGNGKPCEARIWGKPADPSAEGLGHELPEVIQMGSWRLEGGRSQKILFPEGITINVGQDTGSAFTCGYRLSEVLESMKIKPVTFRANVTTPDLVECKDCVEIIFGTTRRPE